MSLDIYGSEKTLIPKDRAFRIEIDNVYQHPTSKKTIRYVQQTVILDGEDGPLVGKADRNPPVISVDFDDVATTTYTFTDPVTQQEVTISLAGVALAINQDYVARRNYQIAVFAIEEQYANGDLDEDQYKAALAALPTPD